VAIRDREWLAARLVFCAALVAIGGAANAADAPSPVIYSATPSPTPSAGTLTIIGFGFTSRNTVRIGGRMIRDVPIASQAGITCAMNQTACHPGINQTLVVAVPSGLAAGPHRIAVQNANGASKSVTVSLPAGRGNGGQSR
jgi:hypothetical protein